MMMMLMWNPKNLCRRLEVNTYITFKNIYALSSKLWADVKNIVFGG